MLVDWLPRAFSRLKIFICYSRDCRPVANVIAQSLRNAGHKVFLDRDTLPPGLDYNEQIRNAIATVDRFIFLASRDALDAGKYTVTELEFVRQRWPAPQGKVFPVIVDPLLEPNQLTPYLRSVQALSISGDVNAEVLAAIERSRSLNTLGRVATAAILLVLMAAAAMVGLSTRWSSDPEVALVTNEKMHFRPRGAPPPDVRPAGADRGWLETPLTVTTAVAYSHRTPGASAVQVLAEEIRLEFGSIQENLRWAYVVEFKDDGPCRDGDWLCVQSPVTTQNVAPGSTSASRETLFLPVGTAPVSWRTFIDQMLSPTGPGRATAILTSRLGVASGGTVGERSLSYRCEIDVQKWRKAMLDVFRPGADPRPTYWEATCD